MMREEETLVATWRSERGVERPAGLAPITGHDLKTGDLMYEAWTNLEGKIVKRENGLPSEISYDGEWACQKWYNEEGYPTFIATPTEIRRCDVTGKVIDFVYGEPPKPLLSTYADLEVPEIGM